MCRPQTVEVEVINPQLVPYRGAELRHTLRHNELPVVGNREEFILDAAWIISYMPIVVDVESKVGFTKLALHFLDAVNLPPKKVNELVINIDCANGVELGL